MRECRWLARQQTAMHLPPQPDDRVAPPCWHFLRHYLSARDDGSFRRVDVERVSSYSARTVLFRHPARSVSKTQPLAKCQLSRAPGMLVSNNGHKHATSCILSAVFRRDGVRTDLARRPRRTNMQMERSGKPERRATRLIFLSCGMAQSAWTPLVPYAKARVHANDQQLGVLLLCFWGGLDPLHANHGGACEPLWL
jgi:hypothetical protein